MNKKIKAMKQIMLKKCESYSSKERDCSRISCSCKAKINRYEKYGDSGIPFVFWDKSLKHYNGDSEAKSYFSHIIKNIDEFFVSGKSVFMLGNLGTGKSMISCCILKVAALSGYSCAYSNMGDIISSITSGDSSIISSLLSKDFLVIDEFDSRWIFPSEKSESLFGSTMEHLLRSRFQNGLPTFICSNSMNVDAVLSEDYSKSIKSMRNYYCKTIMIKGKDYRRSNKITNYRGDNV